MRPSLLAPPPSPAPGPPWSAASPSSSSPPFLINGATLYVVFLVWLLCRNVFGVPPCRSVCRPSSSVPVLWERGAVWEGWGSRASRWKRVTGWGPLG